MTSKVTFVATIKVTQLTHVLLVTMTTMMMINIEYYTKTHSYIPMVTLIWISHSKLDAMVAATTLCVVFLYRAPLIAEGVL